HDVAPLPAFLAMALEDRYQCASTASTAWQHHMRPANVTQGLVAIDALSGFILCSIGQR
ncbi:unnamed protein product, partial [Ceratitis capitata]